MYIHQSVKWLTISIKLSFLSGYYWQRFVSRTWLWWLSIGTKLHSIGKLQHIKSWKRLQRSPQSCRALLSPEQTAFRFKIGKKLSKRAMYGLKVALIALTWYSVLASSIRFFFGSVSIPTKEKNNVLSKKYLKEFDTFYVKRTIIFEKHILFKSTQCSNKQ